MEGYLTKIEAEFKSLQEQLEFAKRKINRLERDKTELKAELETIETDQANNSHQYNKLLEYTKIIKSEHDKLLLMVKPYHLTVRDSMTNAQLKNIAVAWGVDYEGLDKRQLIKKLNSVVVNL